MLDGKRILLVIGGGIAAYKCLDLIRRLRERGAKVRPVMTRAATEFVTPLSVGALAADKVFIDLFDREDEQDVGHIRLARAADLIVVAPATADLMAKMATGLANDLASTILLAAGCPVLIAPAMNPHMWDHPATQRNRQTLELDGISFVGPGTGEMAESGEAGEGRMAEPLDIIDAIDQLLKTKTGPLSGKHVLITSGPTHEPIDPVRYIANRSSGKQGHALAQAAENAGANVTLISGPTDLADLPSVRTVHVETASEMLAAVENALPADVAIMAAAVSDWRAAATHDEKIKKDGSGRPPTLAFVENPDILFTVGHHPTHRPSLVVGFAAETENLIANASAKLARKGADWIIANDVSPETGVMGGDANTVRVVRKDGIDSWPKMSKIEVASQLIEEIGGALTRR
ncbi:MAG: bifunctional phosphopantothenoylcysteine decarboxylase/phosphopantothenate--cysteine ligase CoaBC [Stappiaceae bacterium]